MSRNTYERIKALFLVAGMLCLWIIGYNAVTHGEGNISSEIQNKEVNVATDRDVVVFEGEKVDINNANIDELDTLPGIGPKKAADIVEMRDKMYGFHTVDDLLCIKGIGKKTLANIKAYIEINKYLHKN